MHIFSCKRKAYSSSNICGRFLWNRIDRSQKKQYSAAELYQRRHWLIDESIQILSFVRNITSVSQDFDNFFSKKLQVLSIINFPFGNNVAEVSFSARLSSSGQISFAWEIFLSSRKSSISWNGTLANDGHRLKNASAKSTEKVINFEADELRRSF